MQAVNRMTNIINCQGELDVSGRLIASTAPCKLLAHCNARNRRAGPRNKRDQLPPSEGTDTNTAIGYRLPLEAFYFHRKGAPPLPPMLPIAGTPRKDLGPQFARVDDFAQSRTRFSRPNFQTQWVFRQKGQRKLPKFAELPA